MPRKSYEKLPVICNFNNYSFFEWIKILQRIGVLSLILCLQFNTGNSYWPVLIGLFCLNIFLNILNYLNFLNSDLLLLSFLIFFYTIFIWYKDIFRESHYKGAFNIYLQICFKLGIRFFILRELIFFFSFFWSYFHYIFLYQGEFSFLWPPIIVDKINYMTLPLINTLLLLRRGLTLTIAHNRLLTNIYPKLLYYLVSTILLGLMFTTCQLWEFFNLNYFISTSCYGAIFYLGTGFHGAHVVLGTTILFFCLTFAKKFLLLNNNVFFEIRAWYWHFVDVIWLFLFTEFYWWINFI